MGKGKGKGKLNQAPVEVAEFLRVLKQEEWVVLYKQKNDTKNQ